MSFPRPAAACGFTLVEVLVALAVLAIALGAAIRGAALAADNAAHLRDKTFAHWVAMNQIGEHQLAQTWPAVGEREGVERLAGRDWRWRRRVEPTDDPWMRRLTVRAGPAEGEFIVKLVAFLPRSGAA